MRILALLVVSGAGIIVFTLIIRLMSPSNLSGLARGGLPAIRKGRFNVMGQELEISPVVESKQDEQILFWGSRSVSAT